MDRMGLYWEHIHELNPPLIFGSVKGFNDDSPWSSDLKVMKKWLSAPAAPRDHRFWDGTPKVMGGRR